MEVLSAEVLSAEVLQYIINKPAFSSLEVFTGGLFIIWVLGGDFYFTSIFITLHNFYLLFISKYTRFSFYICFTPEVR